MQKRANTHKKRQPAAASMHCLTKGHRANYVFKPSFFRVSPGAGRATKRGLRTATDRFINSFIHCFLLSRLPSLRFIVYSFLRPFVSLVPLSFVLSSISAFSSHRPLVPSSFRYFVLQFRCFILSFPRPFDFSSYRSTFPSVCNTSTSSSCSSKFI